MTKTHYEYVQLNTKHYYVHCTGTYICIPRSHTLRWEIIFFLFWQESFQLLLSSPYCPFKASNPPPPSLLFFFSSLFHMREREMLFFFFLSLASSQVKRTRKDLEQQYQAFLSPYPPPTSLLIAGINFEGLSLSLLASLTSSLARTHQVRAAVRTKSPWIS